MSNQCNNDCVFTRLETNLSGRQLEQKQQQGAMEEKDLEIKTLLENQSKVKTLREIQTLAI